MKYDPKPLLEEHYHIQELIERQEKRTEDRNYHRNIQKEKVENINLIKDAKLVDVLPFYCSDCKKDFVSMTIKQFEIDWSNSNQYIAYYKTKCDCGKWCIRHITDKFKDAYWFKSKKVSKDRGVHFADTIQPYESNFNLLYGKK